MGRGKFKAKPTGRRNFSTHEDMVAGTSSRPKTFRQKEPENEDEATREVSEDESEDLSIMAQVSEKQVMVVGVDDSEFSTYALEWTLDHLVTTLPNPIFKLVLVFAKPSPSTNVGFIGPAGAAEILPIVEADLKRTATIVIERAQEICTKRSVKDVVVEVVDGDARNVLCDAVEKHHASILVVGSHGYGAIKRAVLGSVSDYCAHHAHCTVMIVKKPKPKH